MVWAKRWAARDSGVPVLGHPGRDSAEPGARRAPSLTWPLLQSHYRHQVVGDVKKGEHRRAGEGQGQIIPRVIHDDYRPRRPEQPRLPVPLPRRAWGRGRPSRLQSCACALEPRGRPRGGVLMGARPQLGREAGPSDHRPWVGLGSSSPVKDTASSPWRSVPADPRGDSQSQIPLCKQMPFAFY